MFFSYCKAVAVTGSSTRSSPSQYRDFVSALGFPWFFYKFHQIFRINFLLLLTPKASKKRF